MASRRRSGDLVVISDPDLLDEVATNEEQFGKRVRRPVKTIAVSGGEVLMLRPAGRDDLKFPGGGVEPGEDDATALARELIEEDGYLLVSVRAPAVTTLERRPARE